MTALVELAALRVRHPGAPVPPGVDLTVAEGESVGLTGPSGIGKTSTALAVLGLARRTGAAVTGQIRWRGLPAGDRELARLRGRSIGWVPQEPASALNPYRRCGSQLAETLPRAGRTRAAVRGLLALVGLDAAAARAYPHELSGGMCQRVLIAAALAPRPSLLLADEPTASLDALTRREILDLLAGVRERDGTALLVVSHDRLALERLCDRTVALAEPLDAGRHGAAIVDPAVREPCRAELKGSAR